MTNSHGDRAGMARIGGMSALALGLFLCNTWSVPLSDPDEGRYAEVAREMVVSGDWLVPHLLDVPYLEKPPLLYWLTAAAMKVFGLTEFAARFAPALAAALGLFATGMFAARAFSARVGIWSVIFLATNVMYFALARLAITDMLFSSCLTLTLLAFGAVRFGFWPERSGYAAMWLGAAVAILAKGPAGVVVGGIIVILESILGGSTKTLVSLKFWTGLPLCLLLALPWFLLVEGRHPGFLDFYVVKEHLQRAGGAEHKQPLLWYVPVVLAGLLPWTAFAVFCLPLWLGRLRRGFGAVSGELAVARFLLVWCAVVFGVFSLLGGKLLTYILPMFPPLAVLLAMEWQSALTGDSSIMARFRLATRVTCGVFGLFGVALVVVPPLLGVQVSLTLRLALGAILSMGALIIARPQPDCSPSLKAIVGVQAGFFVALAMCMPTIADTFMARKQIRVVQARLQSEDEVVLASIYLPSVAFYLQRVPFFIGERGELELGSSYEPANGRFLESLDELRHSPPARRVYVFARASRKRKRSQKERQIWTDLQETLRAHSCELQAIDENAKSALLVLTRAVRPLPPLATGESRESHP